MRPTDMIDSQTTPPVGPDTRGHRLTIAFAATLVLWLAVYFTFMPGVGLSPWLVLAIGGLSLLLGGVWAGRAAGQNPIGGAKLGLATAAINLILLGSMGSGDGFTDVAATALPWMGGFTVAAVLLCAAGAAIGNASAHQTTLREKNWTGRFALIVALTTLVLVKAGGIVTGMEAGLAVPDWLTTFENYPMMFYPIALMQDDSGVFVEHFHRLWGLLVGLSTIVLAVHLWLVDRREWVRWAAIAIFIMVCIQGVLGGTRVTEKLLTLAIVHGIFGQIIFASLLCLASVTSRQFRTGERIDAPRGEKDKNYAVILLAMLLAQLTLGALYRHLQSDPNVATGMLHGTLALHIANACLIMGKGVFVAARTLGLYGEELIFKRLSLSLLVLVMAQFVLGFLAWAVIPNDPRPAGEAIPVHEITITTIHQVTGALLLALGALYVLWTRRLLKTPPAG